MERTMRDSSKKKQTPIGREEFRRQQDIERERFRKELQERNSSKKKQTIKSIKYGLAWGLYLGVSLVIGLVAIEYYTRDWVIP